MSGKSTVTPEEVGFTRASDLLDATTDESPDNHETDGDAIGAHLDLCEVIQLHESIDWRAVDGISTAEAAAWSHRLIEARDQTGGSA